MSQIIDGFLLYEFLGTISRTVFQIIISRITSPYGGLESQRIPNKDEKVN